MQCRLNDIAHINCLDHHVWKLDILFWLGVSYFKCPITRKLNAVQT